MAYNALCIRVTCWTTAVNGWQNHLGLEEPAPDKYHRMRLSLWSVIFELLLLHAMSMTLCSLEHYMYSYRGRETRTRSKHPKRVSWCHRLGYLASPYSLRIIAATVALHLAIDYIQNIKSYHSQPASISAICFKDPFGRVTELQSISVVNGSRF